MQEEDERYKEEKLMWIDMVNRERSKSSSTGLKRRYPALWRSIERERREKRRKQLIRR